MDNLNKFLLIALFILLLFIPKVIFSMDGVSDQHIYSSVVPAQVSLNKEKILIHPFEKDIANTLGEHTNGQSERVAITSIQVILSKISGLDLKKLQFIPFNSIILGFLAFVIAKQFLKVNFYSYAIVFFLMYEPIIGYSTNSTSEHAFGFVLYFTSIIIFLKIHEYKKLRFIGIPIFILLFISSFLTYYTSEFYLIVLSSSFYIILFISSKSKLFQVDYNKYIYNYRLPLILIIIFVMFDSVIPKYLARHGLLSNLGGEGISSLISNFFNDVFIKLMGSSPDISKGSTYLEATSNFWVVWIGYLLYLSLLIPIIIYIFYFFWNSVKLKSISINLETLLFVSILITGFADMLIYLLIGFVGFKYIVLVFPFLTFYSVDKLIKSITFKKYIIILILILCVIKFGVYDYTNLIPDRSYRITDPSAKWFTNIAKPDTNVLTDVDVGGKIQIEAAYANLSINIYPFRKFEWNENVMFLYSNNVSIVDTIFKRDQYDYLMLSNNDLTRPVTGSVWKSFPPIGDNIYFINNYTVLNKIYQDDNIFIYFYKK